MTIPTKCVRLLTLNCDSKPQITTEQMAFNKLMHFQFGLITLLLASKKAIDASGAEPDVSEWEH